MKAILVIDKQESCADCLLNIDSLCAGTREPIHSIGCPLKHPLKSVDNDFYIYDRRYLFDNLDREIKLLMSAKRFEEYMKAKGETE